MNFHSIRVRYLWNEVCVLYFRAYGEIDNSEISIFHEKSIYFANSQREKRPEAPFFTRRDNAPFCDITGKEAQNWCEKCYLTCVLLVKLWNGFMKGRITWFLRYFSNLYTIILRYYMWTCNLISQGQLVTFSVYIICIWSTLVRSSSLISYHRYFVSNIRMHNYLRGFVAMTFVNSPSFTFVVGGISLNLATRQAACHASCLASCHGHKLACALMLRLTVRPQMTRRLRDVTVLTDVHSW